MANHFITIMIAEINRKRKEGELESSYGFHLGKLLRIFDEYQRYYPTGKAYTHARMAMAAQLGGFVVAGMCLLSMHG